jgi:hypothetical protein
MSCGTRSAERGDQSSVSKRNKVHADAVFWQGWRIDRQANGDYTAWGPGMSICFESNKVVKIEVRGMCGEVQAQRAMPLDVLMHLVMRGGTRRDLVAAFVEATTYECEAKEEHAELLRSLAAELMEQAES